MPRLLCAALLGGAIGLVATAGGAATLDDLRHKGFVNCGVSQGIPGFSNPDGNGNWTGLDADTCRALAAAVLGDGGKAKFTPLSEKERFTALQSGEVDVLLRNTTWTLVRDSALGLNFAGVSYYDGQGFLVRKELGLKSAGDLAGAAVCVTIGTTTELNLADYFRSRSMQYRAVSFEDQTVAAKAYEAGKCDVFTSDRSALAALRVGMRNPESHEVLPDVISKEPLGPVVRHGDDQWFDLVKWTLFAMLQAEESGITSKNVDSMLSSKNPAIRRLLGVEGSMGRNLGVDDGWAYRIIKQVGNYAEVYDRNVGPDTPLRLARGINALWKDGGLQFPMPIR